MQRGELVICGFVKKCKVKKCVHREPHQHSDACKGICKHMGHAECREIRK